MVHFDRFRFDAPNQRLEDDSGPVRLNPKAFEVLRVLIGRPGQLVSKDELLDEIWPNTHVADGVLKVCVAEIRRALGDAATEPRFIETVHRRGYRFIAKVSAPAAGARSAPAWPVGGVPADRALVGRDREVELLQAALARAIGGERQVVFLTGEPGAGKTALVEDFVTGAARRATLAITGGQCLEQLGAAEAYMPVLEAVGRLVRERGSVRALLRRYAPTWFAQLPWLIEEADRDWLARELFGAARERMLREMAEFVEALGAEVPLVLVLEDVHWCDPSTVDLLALLATRREPARLLVIATYRPVDLILLDHPLRALARRLVASRHCEEIALDAFDAGAVAEYLERRFPGSGFSTETARLLHARSDGNPLFLVTLVDHLLARGAIVERDRRWEATKGLRDELVAVPESLRLLIEQQIQRLGAGDRELLECASLVGFEFSAAAAAAGADRRTAEAEAHCERLASAGPFLSPTGTTDWPDGTTATRYAFRHALYRETLAATMPARRKAEAHRRIGHALERAYGDRSSELGAELALHFEEGGDRGRAARYRHVAAETAARRYAFAEAEIHLERGLELLGGLPASPERDREELVFQRTLGAVRMATRGYAAPEVERAFARALEIASVTGDPPSAFRELWGLWGMHLTRADLHRALELGVRIQSIAESSGERHLRLQAHHALWMTHFFRGELAAASRHIEEGELLYDLAADRNSGLVYGHDAKAAAISYRAILLWSFGRIDQALDVASEAVAFARTLGHPMSVAFVLINVGWLRFLRREPQACHEGAEAVIAYAAEQQVPFWTAHGLLLRGWAFGERGEYAQGIADLEQGLAAMTAIEGGLGRTAHYANLAMAKARAGDRRAARALMERAKDLVAATGERYHEPEIHRLDAELMLLESGAAERPPRSVRERVEASLHAAIACARDQGARTLELRATTMLARLGGRGDKARALRAQLGDLLAAFGEGGDTADVAEARRLIAG